MWTMIAETLFATWSDAFHDPDHAVADAARIVCVAAGTVMLGLFLATARKVRNSRQYAMYALVAFGVSAIGLQADRIGERLTYHLLLNSAGIIFGIMFLHKTREWTKHPVRHFHCGHCGAEVTRRFDPSADEARVPDDAHKWTQDP